MALLRVGFHMRTDALAKCTMVIGSMHTHKPPYVGLGGAITLSVQTALSNNDIAYV